VSSQERRERRKQYGYANVLVRQRQLQHNNVLDSTDERRQLRNYNYYFNDDNHRQYATILVSTDE